MYKIIPLFFALSQILLFSSCNHQNKSNKKYIIGFSQCTGTDNWRKTMLEEMKRELSFYDNIELVYLNADGNSETQIKQIEELVNRHVNLIIVSPNEVKPLSSIIQKVYDQGIPIVVVDRRTNSNKYTAFIGASNFEVGQNAGRYAASLMKGKGNIIEVTGLPDASPVIDRHNGFIDIIKQYPGLKYIKEFVNYNSGDSSTNKPIEDFLKNNLNIDLVYAQNDFMALDIYKICRKIGLEKKIKFIGIDGLPTKQGGLDMVENKFISATVLYPTGGKEAIITALNILDNKPYKKENQLTTTVIDSTNVRIMKLQSEKVLAQQLNIEERQKKIDEQILITKNQSTLISLITAALLIVLLFGGITYYYLKQNKKITARLAQQNEEISAQKNKLVEVSAKAEVAHQAKLNFFTNISHEFRTPLTLILSPLEELMLNSKVQATTKQSIQLVQKNVMRLYRLVNQLMDFRKIEFNKMQLRASANDLISFVNEIVSSYDTLAHNKNISLKFLTSEKNLQVWFDMTMIDKVIFNLLSNAFKFTKENGYIHVCVQKDNSNAIIIIEDNGLGMNADSISHAFEPFFQGEYENYKGTGLGLALSKELIELHKGSISVKSIKWKVTTFEIHLPLGNMHLKENEMIATPESSTFITEDAKIYITELNDRVYNNSETEENNTQKAYSILIIEDNNDLRNYLKAKLSNTYDIMDAENANTALQITFDNIPDLIICDVVIPGKSGLEITTILKNDIRTAHIPVILLTARSDENQKIEGMKTRADAYITKPFSFQFLEQTIETLLLNREKIKNHYSGEVLSASKSQTTKKTDRKFVSEFTAIVEENISNDNFCVENICAKMGISRNQLYRKVKTVMNCNANDYIVSARLQKARYYLLYEDLSISEVAFKTGFASATYFSTTFKNAFGTTPKEFKSQKNN